MVGPRDAVDKDLVDPALISDSEFMLTAANAFLAASLVANADDGIATVLNDHEKKPESLDPYYGIEKASILGAAGEPGQRRIEEAYLKILPTKDKKVSSEEAFLEIVAGPECGYDRDYLIPLPGKGFEWAK